MYSLEAIQTSYHHNEGGLSASLSDQSSSKETAGGGRRDRQAQVIYQRYLLSSNPQQQQFFSKEVCSQIFEIQNNVEVRDGMNLGKRPVIYVSPSVKLPLNIVARYCPSMLCQLRLEMACCRYVKCRSTPRLELGAQEELLEGRVGKGSAILGQDQMVRALMNRVQASTISKKSKIGKRETARSPYRLTRWVSTGIGEKDCSRALLGSRMISTSRCASVQTGR